MLTIRGTHTNLERQPASMPSRAILYVTCRWSAGKIRRLLERKIITTNLEELEDKETKKWRGFKET
jgi:hypothetical protein